MLRLKLISIFVSMSMLIISCQKDVDQTVPATPLAARTFLNVTYGSAAGQEMDVYLPAGRTTATPVMILVHGGSWNAGDKADLTEYVDSFRNRMPTWAIFNINYRLATSAATYFPAQENDVKSALEFIYNKRSEYVISDKFVLTGVSAGGQLALLQAYKYNSPLRVKAVISFFGPTDMRDMYNNPANPLVPGALVSVMGATPTQDSLLYAHSSPINFVNATSPPTLLLHGGMDNLVRYTQSEMLKNKLQIAGVPVQYHLYPAEGHGWFGANLTDSFNKVIAFLSVYVN